MKLTLVDRGNYYRGLLVLSGRDRIVEPSEREFMLRIGTMLDFEKRFCEAAIDDLIINAHLTREPVVFSSTAIAECFFHDALRLALVDGDLHPSELRWLRRVAHANGLTDEWLDALIRDFKKLSSLPDHSVPLRVQAHL